MHIILVYCLYPFIFGMMKAFSLMMNDTMRFFSFWLFCFFVFIQEKELQGQAISWGDQGNGTYINPYFKCRLF